MCSSQVDIFSFTHPLTRLITCLFTHPLTHILTHPQISSLLLIHLFSVYLTDIHEPTLKNAAHNARLNGSPIPQPAPTTQKIDQTAPSTHPFIECVNIHNNRNNNNNNNSIIGNITGTVFNAPTGGNATAAATAVTEPTTTLYVSKVSWSDPTTFFVAIHPHYPPYYSTLSTQPIITIYHHNLSNHSLNTNPSTLPSSPFPRLVGVNLRHFLLHVWMY